MSESKKIAESLQQKMIVGKRYEIKDLIELLPNTNYEFSDNSLTPNNAEPHRPKWNRWVRNAVRNSPDRTDHKTNWWTDLRAEHVGPRDSDWEYWIEGVEDYSESTEVSVKDSERPIQNDGWLAEQKVRENLEARGYSVIDVSRAGVGYDLRACKGERELFVEVKSSTSSLSITLTQNEWITATKNRDKYWIAYYENFDPDTDVSPMWIRDPAKITPTERQVTEYSLPRGQWHQ